MLCTFVYVIMMVFENGNQLNSSQLSVLFMQTPGHCALYMYIILII
jgi:hypothetical protein